MTAYERYLESDHWRCLRKAKLEFAGYQCNRCRSMIDLHVHHVYYRRSWYQCQLCDLEVLCKACHERVHKIQCKKMEKVRYRNAKAFSRYFRREDRNVCARY